MTDTYATVDDLTARLSSPYEVPEDAAALLLRASELIDYATLGRAQVAFDAAAQLEALSNAACDQVEFWLEVGQEHDVTGLQRGSSLQGGRVQVQKMPGFLGQRARRSLVAAGLLWAGAPSL